METNLFNETLESQHFLKTLTKLLKCSPVLRIARLVRISTTLGQIKSVLKMNENNAVYSL